MKLEDFLHVQKSLELVKAPVHKVFMDNGMINIERITSPQFVAEVSLKDGKFSVMKIDWNNNVLPKEKQITYTNKALRFLKSYYCIKRNVFQNETENNDNMNNDNETVTTKTMTTDEALTRLFAIKGIYKKVGMSMSSYSALKNNFKTGRYNISLDKKIELLTKAGFVKEQDIIWSYEI